MCAPFSPLVVVLPRFLDCHRQSISSSPVPARIITRCQEFVDASIGNDASLERDEYELLDTLSYSHSHPRSRTLAHIRTHSQLSLSLTHTPNTHTHNKHVRTYRHQHSYINACICVNIHACRHRDVHAPASTFYHTVFLHAYTCQSCQRCWRESTSAKASPSDHQQSDVRSLRLHR